MPQDLSGIRTSCATSNGTVQTTSSDDGRCFAPRWSRTFPTPSASLALIWSFGAHAKALTGTTVSRDVSASCATSSGTALRTESSDKQRCFVPKRARIHGCHGHAGRVSSRAMLSCSRREIGEAAEKRVGVGERAATEVRINKCFASFASRRESDRLVASGRARINGKVATNGARVRDGDVVTLDGKVIDWQSRIAAFVNPGGQAKDRKRGQEDQGDVGVSDQFVYLKYWKPRGITCTTDRRISGNIIDAVNHRERIFPVGRLDKDSSGLILLTSDGRLPNSMLRSKRKNSKTYRVTVDRPCSEDDLQHLRDGVVITTVAQRDRTTKPLRARTLPAEVERVAADIVLITLMEGRNRQIRKMMDSLGYTVRALHRVDIMGISLRGLKSGQWRVLDKKELEIIHHCLLS